MGFGQRVNQVLLERGETPASLSKRLGWNNGVLSQYMNNPDKDPRLSTAVKVAKALNVSLEYLAGMEEEPKPFVADPQMVSVLEMFSQLPYKGKEAIMEQLEFQLSKSQSVQDNQVPGVA